MEATHRGAEAVLTVDNDIVEKQRVAKSYRVEQIDTRLREERTEQEVRLLEKAQQAGVPVPEVYEVSASTFSMQFLEGEKLRDVFEERDDLWPRIGELIARLHERDIIHGDLTTSNMIVQEDLLYIIDFGLGYFSQRIEDRATDLRLLKQVLVSTHYTVAEEAFDAIMEAYVNRYEEGDAVKERLAAIEARGRYQ